MEKLTREQAEWLCNQVIPMMVRVGRIREKLERRGYRRDHKLYRAVSECYDALHGLRVTAHYESCGHGVGTPTSESPGSDA
jgi:hypothetical protein